VRAIDGLTGGNVSVANAYVADISSDENRSKNFGKMAISSNLGFIVVPALAGTLGATVYGEVLPVLAALILSSVVLVVIVFILKEIKCSLLMQIPEKMMSGESFRLNLKSATKLQILRDLNSEMFSN
jgi:MFS transporter, DHA1 family, tetracycline resistance protein